MHIPTRLLVILLTTLLLVACDVPQPAASSPTQASPATQKSPASPTAPAAQAQPTAAAPTQGAPATATAPTTVAPTAGPVAAESAVPEGIEDAEGKLLFARVSELNKLNSYRARHVWTYHWSQGNSKGSTEVLVEYVREPYAERVVITRDGELSSRQEVIRHNDITYMLTADGWQALQSAAALFPPEADPRLGMLPYVAGARADQVGEETVDGIKAKHYRYPQDQLVFGDYYTRTTEANADVWVATEQNVYIHALLQWEGVTADMGEGGFGLESRVTDINQPITIQPPEGVEPPKFPEDIVMMQDASEIALLEKAIYYQTHSAPSEVADYYKAKMPANGWTLQRDSRDEQTAEQKASKELQQVTMRFIHQKDGRIINMSIQPGATTLVVMAIIEPEPQKQ